MPMWLCIISPIIAVVGLFIFGRFCYKAGYNKRASKDLERDNKLYEEIKKSIDTVDNLPNGVADNILQNIINKHAGSMPDKV